jgi:hypothetical protein
MFRPLLCSHRQADIKNIKKEIIQLQYLSEICDCTDCYTTYITDILMMITKH